MNKNYPEASDETYYAHHLKTDRKQIRLALRVVLGLLIVQSIIEFLLHDAHWMLGSLIAARAIGFGATLWLLRQYKVLESLPILDTYTARWLMLMFTIQGYSDFLLPANMMAHYLLDVWFILMAFICFPMRLNTIRVPIFYFVAICLAILLIKERPSIFQTICVCIMLPISALTGHAVADYVHTYRRRLLSAELEIERQENTDPVTGLANWREFLRVADIEIQRHKRFNNPLALLVIEIDQFKEIHDRLGAHAGEIALNEVARRIKRSMRTYDSLARYGSEQFCLLLPQAKYEDAIKVAERTRMTVAAMPVSILGSEKKVTINLGITAMTPEDSAASLVQRAAENLDLQIEPIPETTLE